MSSFVISKFITIKLRPFILSLTCTGGFLSNTECVKYCLCNPCQSSRCDVWQTDYTGHPKNKSDRSQNLQNAYQKLHPVQDKLLNANTEIKPFIKHSDLPWLVPVLSGDSQHTSPSFLREQRLKNDVPRTIGNCPKAHVDSQICTWISKFHISVKYSTKLCRRYVIKVARGFQNSISL